MGRIRQMEEQMKGSQIPKGGTSNEKSSMMMQGMKKSRGMRKNASKKG